LTENQGPDGPLDCVGIELDAAIFEEPVETVAVVQRIADRLGGRAGAWQSRQLCLEPGEQVLD